MSIIVAAQTYTILHTDLVWSQRGAVLPRLRRPIEANAMFTQGDIKRNALDEQLTQQPQCLYKASQYRKSSSTEYSNIRCIFGTNFRSQVSVFVPALVYS